MTTNQINEIFGFKTNTKALTLKNDEEILDYITKCIDKADIKAEDRINRIKSRIEGFLFNNLLDEFRDGITNIFKENEKREKESNTW